MPFGAGQLSTRCLVSVRSAEYLSQGRSHCGAYTVKAVLSAFGKDTKRKPEEYQQSWFGKLTGGMFPGRMVQILRDCGVVARRERCSTVTAAGKLEYLKRLLSRDRPVVLLVTNGYRKDGAYDRLKACYVFHWISLWGYDDQGEMFYVYDPAVPRERYAKDIPIGNVKRSYGEILRDWKAGWAPRSWTHLCVVIE